MKTTATKKTAMERQLYEIIKAACRTKRGRWFAPADEFGLKGKERALFKSLLERGQFDNDAMEADASRGVVRFRKAGDLRGQTTLAEVIAHG